MKVNTPKTDIKLPKFKFDKHVPIILILIIVLGGSFYFYQTRIGSLQKLVSVLTQEKDRNLVELEKIGKELEELKNQDQLKRNDDLEKEIKNIETTYKKALSVYEDIIELRYKTKDISSIEKQFAEVLSKLSKKDYSGAEDTLRQVAEKLKSEQEKLVASIVIPANTPQSNAPPGSGYSRQSVNVDGSGTFLVSIIAGDLSNTRVIVDTAADSDCANDCPVLPLATYVSRNGAYAGVNGSYFCPAEYPTCAGKTNSFDLLVMNHKKTYFNSSNNVYSNNPAVIFGDGYVRFVSAASQWGRDTSPNGVLSNFPLLVQGNNIVFGGSDDAKSNSKGGRSFVANKGNTVYIGVVHSATIGDSAKVLKALGMENALNLDNGGSTALWSGGYKLGPGRNIPNAILFVRK